MAYTKASRDGLVPKVDLNKKELSFPKTKTYDLSKELNLKQLADNLRRSINSSRPSSCTFLWGAEREVRRQELDIQHQRNILTQIELLGMTADEMARTQARLFLIPETIKAIISNQREEMAWQRSEALKRMELADKQHTDTLEAVDDRAAQRKLIIEREKAEIRKISADASLTELQGKLLEKVVSELDLNNITPEQAFVLVKALNPGASADVDFGMIEANLEKMRAETLKKQAEARREGIQANQDELAYQQTKKRYD